jgi:hypothetical protein
MANMIAAVGVAISAILAATGYVINQRQTRRERLARVFAEALTAVTRFQSYPFLVARRPDGESIRWLVEMSAEVHAALDFHARLVRLEAPTVSTAFDSVVEAARREMGEYGKQAWLMPAIGNGEDMNRNLGTAFPAPETRETVQRCLDVMAIELGTAGRRKVART